MFNIPRLLSSVALAILFSSTALAQRLIDLDQRVADLTIFSSAAQDELGNTIAAGDLNGDGIADMIIGAPGAFQTGHRGDIYVFYGASQMLPQAIFDLNAHAADIHFIGKNIDDRFGFALTVADVNGDRIDDLITVARSADAPGRIDAGVVYVFFGANNRPAGQIVDLTQTGADLTIFGETVDDFMGTALAAGDINGDSYADIILGASWADPGGLNRAGKVYVIFGSTNFQPNQQIDLGNTAADLTFSGKNATDNIGQSVFAADLTGDNIAEIIFSGWGVNIGNMNNAGAVFAFRGSAGWQSGASIPLATIQADLLITGEAANFFTGDVLNAADFTGDGIADLVISASYASPTGQIEKGRVYIVAGNVNFPPHHTISLSAADITIEAERRGDRLGSSLSSADVDRDGIADLLIGALQGDAAGGIDAGKIYAIAGSRTFTPNHKIDLSSIQPLMMIWGDNAGDNLGAALTSADFDNNGLADIFCGAIGADPPGRTEGGKAFLLKGFCQQPAPGTSRFITEVPDRQQPPATVLPGTNPVNYCAPVAAINIIGYWDKILRHVNATGAAAGIPLSQTAEYLGYFMDTNDAGSNDRANGSVFPSATGTYVVDEWRGFIEFVRWDQQHVFLTPSPNLPTGKSGYNWSVLIDSTQGFSFFKAEIDAGRPAKIDFYLWTVEPTGIFYIDPARGDTIEVYKWGQYAANSGGFAAGTPFEEWNFEEGQRGIGHAVTGVGYIENWTPACINLNADKFAIVHDNWPTTAKNIAIPWASWNVTIAVDPALAPTTIELDAFPDVVDIQESVDLQQNFPNPFHQQTTIQYELRKAGRVKLLVYNSAGKIIKILVNKQQPAGEHRVQFDASELSAGAYYYKISAGGHSTTRKMIVVH